MNNQLNSTNNLNTYLASYQNQLIFSHGVMAAPKTLKVLKYGK